MRRSLLVLWVAAVLCPPAAPRAQTAPRAILDSPSPAPDGRFGIAVAAVGDLDGDGMPDVLVGAPGEDAATGGGGFVPRAGVVHAFSGATGAWLRTYVAPDPIMGNGTGRALLAAGDTNGDGVTDVYVGEPGANAGGLAGVGRVRLMDGATGATLRIIRPQSLTANAGFGTVLTRLGDLTGDGVAEVGVGAPAETAGGSAEGGVLHLVDGATRTVLRAVTSPSGSTAQGAFGTSAADAGDRDGDGVPDVLVGEPGGSVQGGVARSGVVHLFSGAFGGWLSTAVSPDPTLNGGFGQALASLGDVTGDGQTDAAVGASGERPGGLRYAGRAYVVPGDTLQALRPLVSPDAQEVGFYGDALAAVGDLDGDGRADFAVGARAEDDGAVALGAFVGRVYLVSGATGALLGTLRPPSADPDGVQYFGGTLAAVGDLDGDGRADLAVGAWAEQPPALPPAGLSNAGGRVYLYSGAQAVAAEGAPAAPALALAAAPNPAALAVTLRLRAPAGGRLTVTDALGRVVARRDLAPGEAAVRLDVSAWAQGAYLARLDGADGAAARTALTVLR